jgi:hypothetical protein
MLAVLENYELVVLVEFRHCLQQMARVSADSGRLMVHQAGIDAYAHNGLLPVELHVGNVHGYLLQGLDTGCTIVAVRDWFGQNTLAV